MHRRRWKKIAAVSCVLAFTAASCGDDDEGESGDAPAGSTATSAAATVPGGTTVPPTDTEETTADTAETGDTSETDDTTETGDTSETGDTGGSATPTEGVGLIDGIYTGTGGFEIDPAECPEDWDPAQGITDTEIKMFNSLPTSGPFAGFGLLADGAKAYFDYINENGGIDGRKIVLDTKDDGYQPDKTKTNVDEAIQSGNYALLYATLGTPNNLAVWDTANDECMPQLLNATGAPQWGDVENHPWTTGMQLDYFTEAGLWAEWLQKEHPDLTRVAMVTFNNDFGKLYSSGFRAAIEETDIEIVAEELHEPTAPNLTNQFTSLAASDAQVLLIQTSGAFCTQAMAEVEKSAWDPLVIVSATCASLNQFFQPLIDQGLTGAGNYLIRTYIDVTEEKNADLEITKLYNEAMAAKGLDATQSTYGTGWVFAVYMTEILKLAATYEGGLDRGNIMLAARAIDVEHPLMVEGLRGRMVGVEDAYLTEGGQMEQYVVEDPAQLGTFNAAGDLIQLEGETGTYADVQEAMGG